MVNISNKLLQNTKYITRFEILNSDSVISFVSSSWEIGNFIKLRNHSSVNASFKILISAACPQLTVPAFGSYARNAGLRCPGNVVAFQCNAEYALVGQEALTCDASSRWSHPVPVCASKLDIIK